jgi:hypothetical protein
VAGGGRRARVTSSAGSSAAVEAASSTTRSSVGTDVVLTPPRDATLPRWQVKGCSVDLSIAYANSAAGKLELCLKN